MPGNLDISLGTGALLLSASICLLLLILFADCLFAWVALARARRAELMAILTRRVFCRPRADIESGAPTTRPPPVGKAPSAPDAPEGARANE